MTVGTLVVAVALLGHAEGAPRRAGGAVRGRGPRGPASPACATGAASTRRSSSRWSARARGGRSLSLVLGDLDHFKHGERPARASARRRRPAPRRRDPARDQPPHRPGRPRRRRGVRRPAARQRRARRAHRRRAHAPRDPRGVRRGPGAAHDQLRHRELPGTRRDDRRPDGERRPGPLHGQGDRPRLLRDLRAAGRGQPLRPRARRRARGEARLASL